jgi:hypothetical protein
VVTGSGVNAINVYAAFNDLSILTQIVTPGEQTEVITTATTTIVVSSPGAGFVRNVKFLSVINSSLLPCKITISHFDGTTTASVFSINLLSGYLIQYNTDGVGFRVYDTFGNIQEATG